MQSTFLVGCFTATVLLVSSGCGGGDSNPSAPSGPPAPPPSTSPGTVTVLGDRGALSFSPNPASASSNRTVIWRNSDAVVHRIVANDASFDTGNLASGASSAAMTVSTDGTNYHCSIHPGMIGAINAAAGPPPPCTGQYC